jgi:hypothetical protein
MPLCWSQCWGLTAQQMRRTKTVEVRFIRAVVGYRMANHEHKEAITEELEISDVNTRIKSMINEQNI